VNTKLGLAIALLASSLAVPAGAAKCHWWQVRCEESIEGLPDEAPRTGTVITIDVSTNTAYLFLDGEIISRSAAATGSGRILRDGSKIWAFHTPRGHLKVLRKIVDPIWRKPDWAYVEDGDPVPPPDSPKRLVKGHLGKFALDLGDGILIHGTDDARSIGRKVSHGCIRLDDTALAVVYNAAAVGTDVFIFESKPQVADERVRHSDLDVVEVTSPSTARAPGHGGPAAASRRSGTQRRRPQ
jgi:hypothetical protein